MGRGEGLGTPAATAHLSLSPTPASGHRLLLRCRGPRGWHVPTNRILAALQAWGVQPWELLMVGDSGEDIETANAAGTASCLIAGGQGGGRRRRARKGCMRSPAGLVVPRGGSPRQGLPSNPCGRQALTRSPKPHAGGGNETAAAAAAPPPLGAVPTFAVDSLAELQRRLEQRDTALGWGSQGSGSLSTASSDSDDGGMAGAPPEGLEFLDSLLSGGSLNVSRCSRQGGGARKGSMARARTGSSGAPGA